MSTPDVAATARPRSARERLRALAPGRENWLPWTLTAAAAVLEALHPVSPRAGLGLIDWNTVTALAGLLLLTKGIETSGALQALARRVLTRVSGQRRLAFSLAILSASLSAIITNDVCLFLLVPLTRALAQQARLPLARLVAVEALAVNAGSALTPIGNPQNLFLWQRSGLDFAAFVAMMAPTVAIMLALLGATVPLLIPRGSIALRDDKGGAAVNRRLLWIAAGLFVPFVLAMNFHWIAPALLLVVLAFLAADRSLFRRTDWTLLLIIALMFVDMRQLAALPAIENGLADLHIQAGRRAYLAAVLVSQLVSNVPAAILLSGPVRDLPALAAGVSVGGFGLFIGSLANLIALRLSGASGGMAVLHRVSIPFLLVCGALVAMLFRT